MLNISHILSKNRLLRSLTGLNRRAFDQLLPKFTVAYTASCIADKPRQRAAGGGRKSQLLSMADKLFFILLYIKVYPTFDLLGVLFDFHRSRAHRWVHRLQPVLEVTLDKELVLPERQLKSMAEFIERFPSVERAIIDGVERPIQRPKDRTRQKRTYSGKRKRNTRKHIGMSDQTKRLLVLTPAQDGKFQDKCLLDASVLVEHIPQDIPVQVDLGFKGLEAEYENIEIPHKKPPNGTLSEQQKQDNQTLSRQRIVIEHTFSGLKRYGAIADIYRNRTVDFDDHLMVTAAGLWNFYLKAA